MTPTPETELKVGERLVEEEPPPGPGLLHWFGRGLRTALIVLVVLCLLIGLGWLFRLPIANAILPKVLESYLGQPVTLNITQIELSDVTIENIAVLNGPSIATLQLTPNLSLTDGVYLNSISLADLRADIHVTDTGGTEIQGLEALFTPQSTTQSDSTLPQIPIRRIDVSGIQIQATTPIGPQLLSGSLAMVLENAPSLMPMTLDARLNAPDSQSALLATVTAGPRGLVADATLDLSLGHWLPFLPAIQTATGRTTASLALSSGPLNMAQIEEMGLPGLMAALTGSAEIAWSGATIKPDDWSLLTLEDGLARLMIEGGRAQVRLPTPIEIDSGPIPGPLRQLLPDSLKTYGDGNPQITVTQKEETPALVLRPDPGGGWATDFALDASFALGPFSAQITPESLSLNDSFTPDTLSITTASIDMVRGLDLPRQITGHLETGHLDIILPLLLSDPLTHPAFDIPYQADVTVYGDILPPIWARSAALKSTGTARLRQGLTGLDMTIDRGSQLKLDGLTGTGDVRLSPQLRLDVAGRDPMSAGMDFTDPLNSLTVQGAFRLGALSLAIPGADPPLSLNLDRQLVSLRYQKGAATLALGPVDVTIPERNAGLSRAVLHLDIGGRSDGTQSGTATLSAEGILFAGKPILPGRMTASMAISQAMNGTISIDGPISLAEGRVTTSLSAKHTRDGNSHISLETAPIQFGAKNLTLGDILPPSLLGADQAMPNVTGQIDAALDLKYSPAGQSGTMTVNLADIGVMDAEMGAKAINGTLRFDMAHPGATQGQQVLTGTAIAPGLPEMPSTIAFSVDDARLVHIKEATLDLFGGQFALIDTQLDPAQVSLNGTLRLRRVNLSTALKHLEIEGVEGTGTISGLIPVRVTGGDVILKDGSLAAEGGGVLKIDNETVNQALASDQEQVQLLTQTLKDFHYDGLTATVVLPAGQNGTIGLSLSGRNPEVMDGHPFVINVNLESDFRNLFRILLAFMDAYGSVLDKAKLPSP
ncbi:intermembrane phospholipid transport protein YdbH family protein [Hwanghaeella sp. 1Z406]|jgi:hypothetical protein|uniref:intermembrane phospholipid transport protein YdbH family protein n=1 Tax=Hwanghaeella sp. 1Z406 TaxID=3402811 RepID=UPI0026BF1D9E|tara:strand:+ start:37977 stop:40958 length:2982 start_codon:yes stop_codon:yes gene_type:complete